MNRWERKFRDGEPGDGSGQGSPTGESQDPENPNLNDSGEGTQSPFKHPSLKGKTPDEIEAYIISAEAAIKEQGRRLNDLENRPREVPAKSEKKDPDPAEYFKDPSAHTRQIIREEMSEIIKPFERDLALSRVQSAWMEVAEEFDDLDTYKPYIRELLKAQGIETPNAADIRANYYTAVGYVERTARKNNSPPNREAANNRPPNNPQLPASQPNIQQPGKPKVRKLDESERRYARMNKMTDEEYIKYLEEDSNPFAEETQE